jgi:DNA-binding CsgD family transcriptional regulator
MKRLSVSTLSEVAPSNHGSQWVAGSPFPSNHFPVRQFLTALENSGIGVAIVDRHLRFTTLNRRLAKMNDIPPIDHLGKTIHEVVGSLAPTVEGRLEHVFRTGQPLLNVELSGRLGKSPDEGRWLESYFPLLGNRYRVMHVGAFITPVSRLQTPLDQKRALSSSEIVAGPDPSLPAYVVERVTSPEVSFVPTSKQGQITFLSPRETEVLRLLAGGNSNKEASARLGISVKTVEEYRSRLKFKLHAKSLADLIHYAIRHQIICPQ